MRVIGIETSCDETAAAIGGGHGFDPRPAPGHPVVLLGIETSCDETAAAIGGGRYWTMRTPLPAIP